MGKRHNDQRNNQSFFPPFLPTTPFPDYLIPQPGLLVWLRFLHHLHLKCSHFMGAAVKQQMPGESSQIGGLTALCGPVYIF